MEINYAIISKKIYKNFINIDTFILIKIKILFIIYYKFYEKKYFQN